MDTRPNSPSVTAPRAGLRVQHEATALAQATYAATGRFPPGERATLGDQMRRAAVSVAANLAEGCGRPTRADRARLLAIAWGSLRELESHIRIAESVALLPPDTAADLARRCRHTGRLLHALRRATTPPRPTRPAVPAPDNRDD